MLPLLLAATLNAPDYHAWAPKPPMGWNSWDCFGTTVTEKQIKAQADVMAAKLKKYGWQYITVDIQWFEPNAKGFDYRPDAELTMDPWGRLIPAPNRFPSGFKALGDYIHKKGLKFGIHMLRGIPRQAVRAKAPIEGTNYTAADIADPTSTCPWNGDMYGVDMSKPGAQAYYDSVFKQAAAWGIDFVKVDDLSRPYHRAEIEAIRKAIDRAKRPIVFSTSPGETPLDAGEHVAQHANMWRISDDFWDDWRALKAQFERCRQWAPITGPGHFPDADMLPLGHVRFGQKTRFTPDEQITMLTLWSIFRSPLILGCDLTKLDDDTLRLLTNKDVLSVNQNSYNGHEISHRDGMIAWVASIPNSKGKYLALFNTNDDGAPKEIKFDFQEIFDHPAESAAFQNLWNPPGSLLRAERSFATVLAPHAAALYRVTPDPVELLAAKATSK